MFKPFNFTFTPPVTVSTPPPPVQTTVSTTVVGGAAPGDSTKAGQLITKLNQLTAMSQYLQQVIVARTGKIAIEINPAVDPTMGRALVSIYSTTTPPSFITIDMYNQLLNAHIGALQLDMEVGNDSTVEANPIQVADLMTAITTLDSHLINSPSYNNYLPLQLASLKSDAVVFQSWTDALASYPAFYATKNQLAPSTFQPNTIQASGVDVDHSIAAYQSDALDALGASYSQLYKSLAGTTVVDQDAPAILNEFVNQSPQNMLRISAILSTLPGTAFKGGMSDLQNDPSNYVFARLASDTNGMLHQCDQLVTIGVNPMQGNLGLIGEVTAAASAQSSQFGILTTGPMAGMSKANTYVQTNPTNKVSGQVPDLQVAMLGNISPGLKYLGETLNWAQLKMTDQKVLIDRSFRQLMERRISNQNNRNQLMSTLASVTTLTAMANGVVNEFQKGTLSSSSTTGQRQDAVNRILSSLQAGTNTTFIPGNGDQIVVNTPDMPPAPPDVVSVLARAGIASTIMSVNV